MSEPSETSLAGATGNRDVRERLHNAVFGDRIGVTLFLGTLCFAMLYWRAGVFITDNETLVRTLEGLSEGHFWIEPVTDGSAFDGPGAEVRDGYVYGRNYGQLVVSLPFLWLVRALDFVADLRVALFALWHLLALAFVVSLGRLLDREYAFAVGGSALVLASFLVNLSVATQFPDPNHELLALQFGSLVATGLIAVFSYRLVAFQHHTSLGVLAGAASVVVLPVGFWASIPKRHVFSALVCVLVLYLFARSRSADATVSLPFLGPMPVHRAGAYAAVAFLAWVHAAEGLFVFLVLFAVDIPTAPSNDRRTLGFIAVVGVLSLLPLVVTNLFVTGALHRPPRLTGGSSVTEPAAIDPEPTSSPAQESASTSTSTPTTNPSGGDSSPLDAVAEFYLVALASWLISNVVDLVDQSIAVLSDYSRMYAVFIRSSSVEISNGNIEFRAVNLSVLESAPLFGGWLAVLCATLVKRLGTLGRLRQSVRTPRRTLGDTDPTRALAVGFILVFLAIYLSRLPLHVQVTQRYILPVYPLALYLFVGSPIVQRVVSERPSSLLWSYGVGVLVGTQLFVLYIITQELAVAEAALVNASLALGAAAALALSFVCYALSDRFQRLTAVTLGLTCATGTLFVLVSGLHYFSHIGEYILPIVQFLSDLLAPYR